jgi:hypothetical protein
MTTSIDKNVENVQTQPPEEQVILFIFFWILK